MIRWQIFTKLVKIEESLFGLPWVLTSALLPFAAGWTVSPHAGEWSRWLCIVLAFTAARTAGMAFNRVIDRKIDAANPRTKDRPLPKGEASVAQVMTLALVNIAIFIICCGCLNMICLSFSPLVIVLLWLYSYTKRFTPLCHFVLGLIQFFGPFFAWAAVTDSWGIPPILLGSALLASIAGMDILYALQDESFDRKNDLHSIPAVLGPEKSVWMARILHLLAIAFMAQAGIWAGANRIFFIGVAAVAGVYLYYHRKIDLGYISGIDRTFFNCNSLVGLTILTFTVGSLLWHVMS